MTCSTIDHETADAVRSLFACSPARLARPAPITGSDRETARRLVALALALDGRADAQKAAAEIVPAGMLRMELKRIDQAARAAIACAAWAAASDLIWSAHRISVAFGVPLDEVHRMLAAVSSVVCRGPSADLKRGLDILRRDAAHTPAAA